MTAEQDHARDSSENVRFLCYKGFSILSTDFKGNKNVILFNISRKNNVINNCGHGILLAFIITN